MRKEKTGLLPLFRRGILEKERDLISKLLWSRDAIWPRYVSRDWLFDIMNNRNNFENDGEHIIVPLALHLTGVVEAVGEYYFDINGPALDTQKAYKMSIN